MSNLPRTNLIDDFVQRCSEFYDIPEVFLRASGYFILSMTIGRHVEIADLPNKYPWANIFFLLGSDPGFTHRSTLDNITKDVLRENFIQTNDDLWERHKKIEKRRAELKAKKKAALNEKAVAEGKTPTEDEDDEAVEDLYEQEQAAELGDEKEKADKKAFLTEQFNLHILESGTLEGIIDAVAATRFPYYGLMGAEYGETLSRVVRIDSYEYGVATVLSKLYYGESHTQNLSQRGGKKGIRYLPPGKYVSALMMTQDPRDSLTDFLLKQGLLRRCTLIPFFTKDIDIRRFKDPITTGRHLFWSDVLPKFATRLSEVEQEFMDKSVIVSMSPDVTEQINKFAKAKTTEAITLAKQNDRTELTSTYYASIWEKYVKLCALEALAEDNIQVFAKEPVVFVTMEHYKKVKAFLASFEKSENEVLEAVVRRTHALPVDMSFDSKVGRIKIWLADGRKSIRETKRKFNWKDFDDVIMRLIETSQIRQYPEDSSGVGRHKVFYELKKDESP